MRSFLLIYYVDDKRQLEWYTKETVVKKRADYLHKKRYEVICALEVKRFI
jgi:hypothetical protein